MSLRRSSRDIYRTTEEGICERKCAKCEGWFPRAEFIVGNRTEDNIQSRCGNCRKYGNAQRERNQATLRLLKMIVEWDEIVDGPLKKVLIVAPPKPK